MKKIILVRHSRAEDQTSGISDFERSLNTRGKVISRQMAGELMKVEKKPGLFITSPAFRALETALIFATEFNIRHESIVMNSNIYLRMSMNTLHEILRDAGDSYDTVTLFGHNPSFSDLAGILGNSDSDMMPKCGVAVISFDVKRWDEIGRHNGKMKYFLKPDKQI